MHDVTDKANCTQKAAQNSLDEVILQADDLSFSYDEGETWALQHLSLSIHRGRKIAFMGSNGSGKSTFFLCCNGIHRPVDGRLYFKGQPVAYDRKSLLALRSKVGIVFQDPDNQLFSASVYQEISFGVLNLGLDEETAREKVENVIEKLEITPFRHKPAQSLSGGQKKQVSIADILVMEPDIIILDEPAAALDPKHQIIVNRIIDTMTDAGITVLLSTHDVDFAYEWADEIMLFHRGSLLADGTPQDVFSRRDLLARTNLKPPVVLEMFDRLCQKGLLKPSLALPKNLAQLEAYIEQINLNTLTGGKHTLKTAEKKAILVVSFGTSHEDTRKVTIDAIERDIAAAFPDYRLYRAWTSKMIIRKLKSRDGIFVPNVREAMEQMASDGITHVIVQPTHVINGIENDLMKEDALSYCDRFQSILFGDPLLTTTRDSHKVIDAVAAEFADLTERQALVLMGHGTTHFSNSIYAALDYTFKDCGHPNIFLGTVEAYPSLDSLLKLVKCYKPEEVVLSPFMIVAGDHAKNDMAGDDPDSWYSRFTAEGYPVRTVLRGLGEYPAIRQLFIDHVKEVICEQDEEDAK